MSQKGILRFRTLHIVLGAGVLSCMLLTGCAILGSASLGQGRGMYSEALSRTEGQQMLTAILANRYEETAIQLKVTSITANIRASANAGVQLGFGRRSNYEGNLVPFSGGVTYEENPTITYSPLQGATYMRELLSPVPLDLVVPFFRTMDKPTLVFRFLVREINGVRNPAFHFPGMEEPGPEFDRLTDLFSFLRNAEMLDFAKLPEKDEYVLMVRPDAADYAEELLEFLAILNLPPPPEGEQEYLIPVRLSFLSPNPGEIVLMTRSIFDMVEILAAAAEVPDEDIESGTVRIFPPMGLAGKDVRIQRASRRPQKASVWIRYRGDYYFIDEQDQLTKAAFQLLRVLFQARLAGVGPAEPAPVLTVPVSK
jgi:hypothetical protein